MIHSVSGNSIRRMNVSAQPHDVLPLPHPPQNPRYFAFSACASCCFGIGWYLISMSRVRPTESEQSFQCSQRKDADLDDQNPRLRAIHDVWVLQLTFSAWVAALLFFAKIRTRPRPVTSYSAYEDTWPPLSTLAGGVYIGDSTTPSSVTL